MRFQSRFIFFFSVHIYKTVSEDGEDTYLVQVNIWAHLYSVDYQCPFYKYKTKDLKKLLTLNRFGSFTEYMHRSAKFQTPPNGVDLLWSCEGLWMGLSFVFSRSDCQLTIQWTRQFRVIDSSGSPSHKHFCFFQNVKVYRFIYYPVIFPNLLAAWNLLLVVKCWFTDVVITKRLTAPLPWKVKIPVKVYIPLLKQSFKAILSAKHVLFTYRFVENLPLTNIL